jgi:predicted Zn-dependent protease
MRIAFEAPPGFTLTNSPQAILIEGPDGMRGEFGGGAMPAGGVEAYTSAALRQLLRGASVQVTGSQRVRVNGLDALVTSARVQGGQEPVALTMIIYDAGAMAYHFVMLSSPAAAAPPQLQALFSSFRLMSEAEARSLRPRVIDTVRARAGDDARSLAQRMAGDNKLGLFLMLNGRTAGQPVRPGEYVKLVVYGSR